MARYGSRSRASSLRRSRALRTTPMPPSPSRWSSTKRFLMTDPASSGWSVTQVIASGPSWAGRVERGGNDPMAAAVSFGGGRVAVRSTVRSADGAERNRVASSGVVDAVAGCVPAAGVGGIGGGRVCRTGCLTVRASLMRRYRSKWISPRPYRSSTISSRATADWGEWATAASIAANSVSGGDSPRRTARMRSTRSAGFMAGTRSTSAQCALGCASTTTTVTLSAASPRRT